MRKLEYGVRALCWLGVFLTYALLAAWVTQGDFSSMDVRFYTALAGCLWAAAIGGLMEDIGLPQSIVRMLMEDEE